MLDMVETAFAPELLGVSMKAGRLADFAWAAYKIGGTIPMTAFQGQFEKAEEYVSLLSKTGVMRYALGGFINRDQKRESLSVCINEDFKKLLAPNARRKEFGEILFRNFGERMMPYCRTELTEPLAVMLTSIIFYATPDKPAFVNIVLRKASKASMRSYIECNEMLDYYLNKFLGLVALESGSLINLTVRSKQRIRSFPKIWDMYVTEHRAKTEEIPKQEHKSPPSESIMEQERKLRGYFPWLKL